MDQNQNHVEIEIHESLDDVQKNIFWEFYLVFLKKYKPSIQSKPVISNKVVFDVIIANREIFKIILKKNNKIIGYWLATTSITNYPESHYSSEYFTDPVAQRKNLLFAPNIKPVFLIGDNCGFILTKDTDDLFRNGNLFFEELLKKLKDSIEKKVNSKIYLVLNYSELSLKVSNLFFAESLMNANRNRTLNDRYILLDEESFVHIYWKGTYTKKTRAEWLLKMIGRFIKIKNNSNGAGEVSKKIYEITSPFIKSKYSIVRSDIVPENFREECYQLYHERLNGANTMSPQKLEYSHDEFINYLKDPGFIKYLLIDKSQHIKGIYLLIGKENSKNAHWVSSSWRIADAYIKLILTQKGIPAFGYLILFVAGTWNLLKEQGTDTEARVLADWSEKINGRRFREDLNISMAPLLPKIFTRGVIKKRGQFFAEILTNLARINAVQIDSDVYLAYY
jgi:hypothetical protein